MPSVYSFSRPSDCPSSTVITPSLPTLSITSAMISPTSGSAAEIAATAAICSRVETSTLCFSSSATTAATASSMPRLTTIGLAPAVTTRRPSETSACPRTTAVVVPSPATSSVLVATSLRSCAPMFSNGSSSSTSRAIVTPSFVIVGDPNFLSRTTFRPFGPIVTRTASASLSMPFLRLRRAVSSKINCLANLDVPPGDVRGGLDAVAFEESVLDDREDVLLADDEELLVVDLEFGPGVLRVEDRVALLDVDALALAVIEGASGPDGQDGPLLGLFLRGIGKDDAALGHLLARGRLDHDAIAQRAELRRGNGGGGQRAFLLGRRRLPTSDSMSEGRAGPAGPTASPTVL